MHRKISVKVESPYETPPLIYAKAQSYYVRDIARYFAKAFPNLWQKYYPTFGKGVFPMFGTSNV